MSQPQYSQPQYSQPADSQPPPGYYPVPPTNTMAILSLIFVFVFWPLAIVFGHIARRQIAHTGEGGRGLATAGLVLGYVILAGLVLAVIAMVVLTMSATSNDPYSATQALTMLSTAR